MSTRTEDEKTGATLEQWANKTPERLRSFAQEGLIVDVTETIYEAMAMREVNKTQLAKLLGCSKVHVTQMLNGTRNVRLRTLSDMAHVLGYKVEITFKPRGKL